jgi:hypothetical protein
MPLIRHARTPVSHGLTGIFFTTTTVLLSSLLLSACGAGSGDSHTAPVTPVQQNRVPVVDLAALNQTTPILPGQKLVFDASASRDPDGDVLSYSWSISHSGQAATLFTANTARLEYTPPAAGQYQLQLTISDGKASVSASPLSFIVIEPPRPTARTGAPQTIKTGQWLQLSAVNSQPASTHSALTAFSWKLRQSAAADSSAEFSDASSITPLFRANKAGRYELELTVTDSLGQTASSSQLVSVTDANTNSAPQAVILLAGSSRDRSQIGTGQQLVLQAAADADADHPDSALRYQWQLSSQPAGSQSSLSADGAQVQFNADLAGDYSIRLTVTDPLGASHSTQHLLQAKATDPAPIAQIKAPTSGRVGDRVALEAVQPTGYSSASLQYQWQLLSRPAGSQARVAEPQQASSSLTPDLPGQYLLALQLQAGDSSAPLPQTTTHWLIDVPARPQARIIGPDSHRLSQILQLDGSSSTQPDQPLQYQWQLLSAPDNSTTLIGSEQAVVRLQPASSGWYQLGLTVRLAGGQSQPSAQARHFVYVSPDRVPEIGFVSSRLIDSTPGSLIKLDASASRDPELLPLQYSWTLEKPAGSQAELLRADSATPEFTADIAGIYRATLTLTDAAGNQVKDQLTVNVKAAAELWRGTVKGRFVAADGAPLTNAPFVVISNNRAKIDANGYFSTEVAVSNSQPISITHLLPQLFIWRHRPIPISQNNFVVDLGIQQLPAPQPLSLQLTRCAGYQGPTQLKLLLGAEPPAAGNWSVSSVQRAIVLDLTQPPPYQISLSAPLTYRISLQQPGLTLSDGQQTGTTLRYQHQFRRQGEVSQQWTVCQ